MQDRIPVNPGRVLISPENGAPYYATMTRADNATQEGTPLNKNSLLRDATAALFGLGADAVPDDVFGVLSRFQNGLGNEYVWKKTKSETNINLGSGTTHASALYLGTAIEGGIFYYSDDPLAVAQKTCDVYTSSASTTADKLQTLLGGKYFTVNNVSHEIFYADPTVTFSVANWDYWQAANITQYANFEVFTTTTVYGYVNSPDPNAYPIDDGYTYTALGQLGNKVQIEAGSYVGTGVSSGSYSYNLLNFGFKPAVVFIKSATSNVGGFAWIYGTTQNQSMPAQSTAIITSWNENTLEWNTNNGSNPGLNNSGETYNYVTVG